jgi:hypothetical protein
MNFVLIVSVMVYGSFNSNVMQLNATSNQCVYEQQVIAAMNRANINRGVDILYFGECRTR